MNEELSKFLLYTTPSGDIRIDVYLEQESVWLTQKAMAELFGVAKSTISEHLTNIYDTNELDRLSTVRKFRTVQNEGGRSVTRTLLHYNLDMIISIGYRVNSIRGTQFRIWANKVLKDYLLKGYAVNQRFERLEHDVHNIKNKLSEIDFQIKTNLPPKEGIYFDGQIFDAYVFVADLIRGAKQSIVLIDNYVDESVLLMLSKKHKGVKAIIYTSILTKEMKLDLKKCSSQYPDIDIKLFTKAHDRFLIIDNQAVYHIGASLKDLGKKWFAFSKIALDAIDLLKRLEDNKK